MGDTLCAYTVNALTPSSLMPVGIADVVPCLDPGSLAGAPPLRHAFEFVCRVPESPEIRVVHTSYIHLNCIVVRG